MIACLIAFFVFVAGYLVAAVDWRDLIRDAFTVQNMQNQGMFLFCIGVLLTSYALIFMFAKMVYENTQSKFNT
jgi:hypothetical protein